METQLGSRPSYIWRSVFAAKGIIDKGSWWCIRNGRNVKVWDDRWLPSQDSFKIVSSRPQGTDINVVASLLDHKNGSWDATLVRSTFLTHEADTVLSIPISPSLLPDSLIWAWTLNGCFSVWSAYQVALRWIKEGKHKDNGEGNSNTRRWKIYGRPFGSWIAQTKSSILCGRPVGTYSQQTIASRSERWPLTIVASYVENVNH